MEVVAQTGKPVILDDVIGVAEEVRKGTESVMKIVNDLNGSTEVVNGAMKETDEQEWWVSEYQIC